MLIEFSGPSASGKTEFVRYLLKTWPETRSVRRSVSSTASPIGPKLRAAVSHAHEAPRVFWNANKWHKHGLGLSNNPVRASLRMAVEYSLLKGLSQDARLWLLDQGRLQLGSWLPQEIAGDPVPHTQSLKNCIQIGRGIVLFSLQADFLLARIGQRGDFDRATKMACARGYSSLRSYCHRLRQQEEEKIKLARVFGSAVLIIKIDKDGGVAETKVHGRGLEYDEALNSIAAAFRSWWDPFTLLTGHQGTKHD